MLVGTGMLLLIAYDLSTKIAWLQTLPTGPDGGAHRAFQRAGAGGVGYQRADRPVLRTQK